MWFTQIEFEKHIQPDTLNRLDFSDDGPSWSYWQDGTYVSVFSATPEEPCGSSRPTFQANAINKIHPDGTEEWEISTFVSPHPGSFETVQAQQDGFWELLYQSSEPIRPEDIDRELNLRYFAWQDRQTAF